MRCVNRDCSEQLEQGSAFCPFCGSPQLKSETRFERATEPIVTVQSTAGSSGGPAENTAPVRVGEKLLVFTQDRSLLEVESAQPLEIRDERVTHLAHTDRRLSMQELFQRVTAILAQYEVPVEVSLVRARWHHDEKETRERIVASLRDHAFTDMKMVMGLDYMGRWASFQLYLGSEPEPPKKWQMPKDVMFALLGGALALLIGMSGKGTIGAIGLAALAYAAFRAYASHKAFTVESAANRVKRQLLQETRTYKQDDMRLFCTAMQTVYSAVVNDVVQKHGGKVVRVEGGQGGFFQGSGTAAPAPGTQVPDAAALEV